MSDWEYVLPPTRTPTAWEAHPDAARATTTVAARRGMRRRTSTSADPKQPPDPGGSRRRPPEAVAARPQPEGALQFGGRLPGLVTLGLGRLDLAVPGRAVGPRRQ